MGRPQPYGTPPAPVGTHSPALARPDPANLADVLERVLDKGIVIAGDIRINLVDIELLTIRIRLLVASVDRAREMGIDWWENDPMLSSRAVRDDGERRPVEGGGADRAAEPAHPQASADSTESGESPDSGESADSGESPDE